VSCTRIDIGPLATAWLCGRRTPTPSCSVPHCGRAATALCDFPLKTKTCSAKLCETHRKKVGPERDMCPAHAKVEQLALGVP
jgi:hypothetical protein